MSKVDVSRRNYQGCSVLYFDDDPGLTEQHHRDDCDINNIMAKFTPDALAAHAAQYQGQYGDFSDLPDYHTALSFVRRIDDIFMDVPAEIRNRFDNDPGKFLAFVDDPNNRDEMFNLGLLNNSVQSLESPKDTLNAAESSEAPGST